MLVWVASEIEKCLRDLNIKIFILGYRKWTGPNLEKYSSRPWAYIWELQRVKGSTVILEPSSSRFFTLYLQILHPLV